MSERTAIYPGTFDPITNGHIDIICRASKLFDKLIVAVAHNPGKGPLFTVEDRLEMIKASLEGKGLTNVEVESFSVLLTQYARAKRATTVIRGLRAVSDFEYEFQMALMNRKLCKEVETVFMMPSESYTYLSSRIVKEIALYGGNVRCLVPPLVADRLEEKAKLLQIGKER
jgi:pantetheine-phosphate adenylyltransferase